MKFSRKFVAAVSTISALAIAPLLLMPTAASAQPRNQRGTDANYVGAGIAAGVLDGTAVGETSTFGGNIQGRITVPNAPVSVRGAVLFSDQTSAIMPMISYDAPVARNTNVYAGAGYSFVEQDGQNSPLGTRDSVVLTTGVESEVVRNVIVYGDAKLGLRAYQESGASALSLQLGAGYRF